MFKSAFVALLIMASADVLPGQGAGQRGGRAGAAADRTNTGFGTTNTLTTIPEAGSGSAAAKKAPGRKPGAFARAAGLRLTGWLGSWLRR